MRSLQPLAQPTRLETGIAKVSSMKSTLSTHDSDILAGIKNTPASVQAAFEVLATLQLLQEVADTTEAVLGTLAASTAARTTTAELQALLITTTSRLIDVSRRQMDAIRTLMQV